MKKCPRCNSTKINKFYDNLTKEYIIACKKCGYKNKRDEKNIC